MNENELRTTGLRLWNEWTTMWNGRPSLARTIVAPHFALHLSSNATIDPNTIDSPEAVERWVTAHRATFRHLAFHNGVGPFVDVSAGVVAGPWYAEARTDDAPRWVCGIDTIAFRDGKITEYWTLSTPFDGTSDWVTARALTTPVGPGQEQP